MNFYANDSQIGTWVKLFKCFGYWCCLWHCCYLLQIIFSDCLLRNLICVVAKSLYQCNSFYQNKVKAKFCENDLLSIVSTGATLDINLLELLTQRVYVVVNVCLAWNDDNKQLWKLKCLSATTTIRETIFIWKWFGYGKSFAWSNLHLEIIWIWKFLCVVPHSVNDADAGQNFER